MAHIRDKKPPTPLKPIGFIHASDEQYVNEVVDSYRLHDLRRNPPPPPLTKARHVIDSLWQQANSQYLDGDAVTRSFQRSLKALGLRQIRFHDLRHTHATQLLTAGVPVKVVQERLGHESAKMTLDLYGHFAPGLQQKFIAELDISGLPQETADALAASGQIRTDDRRFTKPLLYP
jgi:integrase